YNISTPLDSFTAESSRSIAGDVAINKLPTVNKSLVEGLYAEVLKLIQERQGHEAAINSISFTSNAFASSSSSSFNCVKADIGTWIIDSGATDHVTPFHSLLIDIHTLPYPISIRLPDGSCKSIQLSGSIFLNPSLKLENVLFVPEFSHNLLSVH